MLGSEGQDGTGSCRTPQCRHSCPIPAPPSRSSDPTGATEGRLKPRLGREGLMASEALDMNCQHCGTASHCSHPLQEEIRAAESLNCC